MKAEFLAMLICFALNAGAVTAQPRYSLTQVFRIGSVDGPDALTALGPTTLLPDGGLAVTQRQDGSIKVFGPGGRLRTTIGRTGRGPGEFRHIAGVGVAGDTALWVSDISNRRLSYFDLRGQLQAEVTWSGLDRTPYRPVLNGTAFFVGDIREGSAPPDTMWAIRTYDRTGALLDTIAVFRRGISTFNIGGRSVANPLGSGLLPAYSPDGSRMVLVDRSISRTGQQSSFTVTWIDIGTKETIGRQSFSYDPIPIPPELLDRLAARYRAGGAPPEYGAGLIEALRKLRFLPPVTAVVSVGNSAVWIGRETNSGRPTTRWYHISLMDGITGYVELPSNSRILCADRGTIVVAEQGDFDVPFIVAYNIRGK